jgi:hypothetical protein
MIEVRQQRPREIKEARRFKLLAFFASEREIIFIEESL